jgi:hypothetical protein
MLNSTIKLTTITMIKSFRIKRFSLWVAESPNVISSSFSVNDVSCVVLTLVGKSSIAINGSFWLAIVSCIVLTSSKVSEVLSRYNHLSHRISGFGEKFQTEVL